MSSYVYCSLQNPLSFCFLLNLQTKFIHTEQNFIFHYTAFQWPFYVNVWQMDIVLLSHLCLHLKHECCIFKTLSSWKKMPIAPHLWFVSTAEYISGCSHRSGFYIPLRCFEIVLFFVLVLDKHIPVFTYLCMSAMF